MNTEAIIASLSSLTDPDVAIAAAAAVRGRVSPSSADEGQRAVENSLRHLLRLARTMPAGTLVAAANEGNIRNAVFSADDQVLEAVEDALFGTLLEEAAHEAGYEDRCDISDDGWDRLDGLGYEILADAAMRLFAPVVAAAQ